MNHRVFAELERKISAMEGEGIDVISLGIGDPDLPTPEAVIHAAAQAMRDPATHDYPTNHGTKAFREAVASFYGDRFGVDLEERFSLELNRLTQPGGPAADGLVRVEGGGLTVTEIGRLFVRNVCMVFDTYLAAHEGRPVFSRTV